MQSEIKKCAGIVTFNPDITLLSRVLHAVYSQVEKVYIYDNASENIEELRRLINDYVNLDIIESEKNDGIAKALNQLCGKALSDGFDWILTLDHDTVICDNFVEKCMSLTCEDNVAVICPRVHYLGFTVKEKGDTSERFSEVPACMTSGSFMSLAAWKGVGGFDESMFIDWVDNDICTNLRLHNFRILRSNDIFMEHRLGNVKKRRFLFWKINDFQYSGTRIYYIIRNGIYYRRKYRKFINGFKIFIINTCNVFKFLYFNAGNRSNRKSVWRGIKDGRKMEIVRFDY